MANTAISEAQKELALSWIARGYSRMRAAAEAGFDRENFKRWSDESPAFKARFDAAYEQGNDVYRDEVRRRGIEGVVKPIYQGGERVDAGEVREFSDTLLIFQTKMRMPEYRDQVRVDQHISGQVQHTITDLLGAATNGGFARGTRLRDLMAGKQEGQS